MEIQKKENIKLQKSNRKKPVKKINYKAENEKLRLDLARFENTVKLDYTKTISIDFSFNELFWLKKSIGDELVEIEEDLVYYDDDDKLPPKKQGHKYIIAKLKVLEDVFEKLDCLTI